MNELLKEDELSAKALLIVATLAYRCAFAGSFGENKVVIFPDFPLDQVDKGTLT
jgi:hypothetical protein